MWQVYLGVKDYTAALEHCRDGLQKDHVYVSQVTHFPGSSHY